MLFKQNEILQSMKKPRRIEYSANIPVIKACNTVLLYVKWTEMVTVTVLSEVDCSQERGS